MSCQQIVDVATQKECLEQIKDWLKKTPHLPDKYDEKRLLAFLRGCKYSLEKCKQKLDMYFTVRTVMPQYFTNRDIKRPELQDLLKDGLGFLLPSFTPDGYRVGFVKGPDENTKIPDPVLALKILFMMADMTLDENFSAGEVFVIDCVASKPKHILKVTPTILKDAITIGLKAYPVIIKGIHFINLSPWMIKLHNIIRPLLPMKLQKRIFLHSDMSTLYEYVPQELLPVEYGGNSGSMYDLYDQFIKRVENYTDWFQKEESIKSNEALRQDKTNNIDEIFGAPGSFRQLSID